MLSRYLRRALCAFGLYAAAHAAPSAQITIAAADNPGYRLGSGTTTSTQFENEDGALTETLEALVAQSGAGQVWDFSALSGSENSLSATITNVDGVVGPEAETAPSALADRTSLLEFELAGEEDTLRVFGESYSGMSSEGLIQYGSATRLSEEDGSFLLRYLPEGRFLLPTTFTFGDSWTAEYEVESFGGAFAASDTVQVDGYGTILLPGRDPEPALRLRTVTVQEGAGTSVGYVFYTANYEGVQIVVQEEAEPYAELVTNQFSTAADERPDAARFAVGAPFPNPTAGDATLRLSGPAGEAATVAVYDVLGREVLARQRYRLGEAQADVRLDTRSLPAGRYVVRVQAEGTATARPLTVVR